MEDGKNAPRHCFIHFEHHMCMGCSLCVKRCPTRAIRVRNGKATIKHSLCIGCGECIRICESGAITASTSELNSLNSDKITIALVSPVLYSQFPGVLPRDILQGLKNMGFTHAVDMSYYFEMFQWATAEYISRNRKTGESPWPLISPVCPVVLRLIVCRFPILLPHVHPIMRPVALMARDVMTQFKMHYGVEDQDIVLYYINPCPSKMGIPKKELEKAGQTEGLHSTGALGINDIYAELSRQIKQFEKNDKIPFAKAGFEFEQCTSGGGLLWSMTGGEAEATGLDKILAVAGLTETITYLEKIELGLFNDLEYIEFRTCREGCIGGALNAIDKYLAKSAALKMAKTLGVGTRLNRERVLRLYDNNWFFPKITPQALNAMGIQKERTFSFEELSMLEKIVGIIDGKSCGACGSPDCRTFAEDLLRDEASPDDCVYLKIRGITKEDILNKVKLNTD
ncbi:MAG: [Fe-Fe] hydrogenase large subunit C-terminal domain-containing protein [Desulfobacteraceae bacterium]|jgi:Na+-translocating ferredoxin:NAD+ oxidoreductase RNF subunit RnfB